MLRWKESLMVMRECQWLSFLRSAILHKNQRLKCKLNKKNVVYKGKKYMFIFFFHPIIHPVMKSGVLMMLTHAQLSLGYVLFLIIWLLSYGYILDYACGMLWVYIILFDYIHPSSFDELDLLHVKHKSQSMRTWPHCHLW